MSTDFSASRLEPTPPEKKRCSAWIYSLTGVGVGLLVGGTMAGLLLVWIFNLRTSSFRVQTDSCLKQCALGLHNYHDAFRKLPDAYNNSRDHRDRFKSAWFKLLPYVEQDIVFVNDRSDAVIPVYRSPLDPLDQDSPGKLSFAANLRVFAFETLGKNVADNIGVAFAPPEKAICGLSLPMIADGTSNVILLTTRRAECDGEFTEYNRAPNESPRGGFFGAGSHMLPPARGFKNANDLMFQIMPGHEECNAVAGVYGHAFTPESMSVALCDGSTRNVSSKMSPSTFMRALCPSDGQPLGAEWFE